MESPMAEVRIKDIDEHEIDTILAEDIDFEGHLTFKKPLMIKGKFKGEIKSSSSLYIGEKAFVEATTEAAVVSSKGAHKGDIIGHSRVELFSTAQVDGDITTPDFVVESGCKFNGYCNMGGVPQKDGAHHAHPAQPASQPSSPNAGTQQPPPAPAQQPPRPQAAPQNPGQNQQQNPGQNQQKPAQNQQQAQHNQQQNQHNQQQNQQQKPGAPSQGSGGQQR
jgi:cytoskeletal protein CcmA (bactofilin family)